MRNGYVPLGDWNGVPVRVHWTAALGAAVFTGFRFAPAAWCAFVFLIFVHEVGHAVMILASGARVRSIDLVGVGGECRWTGHVTTVGRAAIAWGGVVAQLLLFVATWIAVEVLGRPADPAVVDVVRVFTTSNVLVIMVNLVPVPPLDGYEAWKRLAMVVRGGVGRLRHALVHRSTTRRLAWIDRAAVPALDSQVTEQVARALGREPDAPPGAREDADPGRRNG